MTFRIAEIRRPTTLIIFLDTRNFSGLTQDRYQLRFNIDANRGAWFITGPRGSYNRWLTYL